jgi:hypothetical protein
MIQTPNKTSFTAQSMCVGEFKCKQFKIFNRREFGRKLIEKCDILNERVLMVKAISKII